ncbi:MAG: hypothetical protein EHM89_05435 [Acidobacteria bacterium]|nr:MAG: hypothetical protein EHM89_05435 [Acidobacteriota bacterium]
MPSLRTIPCAVMALLALTSCRGPEVDIGKALEVTDVTTGWYDAGVENGLNKLLPTVGFRLKNVTTEPVSYVQLNAVFRLVGESEVWGGSLARAIDGDGLAPGAVTDRLELRSDLGYTSTEPRATMLTHSQFKDANVKVFAKHGGQQWAPLGEWNIDRAMLAR